MEYKKLKLKLKTIIDEDNQRIFTDSMHNMILASVRCVTQVQVVEHKEKNKVKSDTLSKSPKIIKRKINANTRRTN